MKMLASILFLPVGFGKIFACTCANTNEAQNIENLKKSGVVFQGRVVSISDPLTRRLKNSKGKIYGETQYLKVEFKVLRAWKGVGSDKIIIETDTDNEMPEVFWSSLWRKSTSFFFA